MRTSEWGTSTRGARRRSWNCFLNARRDLWRLLLLQHELALLLDQAFRLLGYSGQEPGQVDLDAGIVLGDVDLAAGRLAQHGDAQVQVIARPVFLQDLELAGEAGPRLLQSRFQAAHRLLPTETVRDRHDNGLRHERRSSGGRRFSCGRMRATSKPSC